MEFKQVAKFLQEIEAKVRETAQEGQTNRTETLKNSLLGGKVSVALCYLEPSVKLRFDAPGQDALIITLATVHASVEKKVRAALLKKLKVMYGVANPYEEFVKGFEEEYQEEVSKEEVEMDVS